MPTKAIPSSDPKKDLRVIWSGDNKRIVADHRPPSKPPTQPVRRVKVLGPRRKQ